MNIIYYVYTHTLVKTKTKALKVSNKFVTRIPDLGFELSPQNESRKNV